MKTLLLSAALLASGGALSQSAPKASPIEVQQAWVRATVPGQTGTGGFMTLLSKDKTVRLVGVASSVAGVGEVHEMKMEGSTMKMAALKDGLELPAGQAVELKPGGLHLMLMDLKTTLRRDTTIAVTLTFKGADGKEFKQTVNVPVSARSPHVKTQPAVDDMAGHKH
jgi:periplasmic copper chaperone A